jgi:CheY-like chemotaxis protein
MLHVDDAGRRRVVLLVEDQPSIRAVAAHVLNADRYHVRPKREALDTTPEDSVQPPSPPFSDGKAVSPIRSKHLATVGEQNDCTGVPIAHPIVGREQATQVVLTQVRREGLV